MPDSFTPRPPGRLQFDSVLVEIGAIIGRVGDGLVYAARLDGRAARLREYAPVGIVQRLPDGKLHPAQAQYAAALDAAAARFLAQAEQLARTHHAAIAPIWRGLAIESGGACAIGAPVGISLAAQLVPGQPLPPGDVMRLAADLADALAMLHAHGLTHLDIAPETLVMTAGRIQLTDFAVDNRPFMPLLGSQEGLVRPGYSPIEHYDAAMAEPLGPPADIYSASALLFRLITGREPTPWQERWRDPAAASLPAIPGYSPAFLAAVRKGMAIEPGDRFPDGTAWRDALGLPPTGQAPASPVIRRDPVPPNAPPPQPPSVPPGNWLLPLALALAVILIALTAYLAYTQRWFLSAPQEVPQGNSVGTILPPVAPPRPVPSAAPMIQPGATVSGRLTAGDQSRGAGQLEDRFTLDAVGGERLDIRLSSSEFDPLLSISGPGLSVANDDDPETLTRDSRLLVTLPRAGRYTISVSSYDRGETGAYLLDIRSAAAPAAPPPDDVATLDLSRAARLAGRWAAEDDEACEAPAINRIDGDILTSRIDTETLRHRIIATDGDTIDTQIVDGRLAGRRFAFRVAEDGDNYTIAGEIWTRC